ncbi:PREDICTED: uncharacterized protein LOC104591310 [Nelumbo nucifera]|uniref:Uncharacterized protein LOC104591310 n=1 Tax=Nelumbo nucifera TaxID=4432 RepID=A0A1U7Z7M9_NELNU|nr:PREDICTED: uncharacterized protein LOC104591310 [Nelumbo nucifera]
MAMAARTGSGMVAEWFTVAAARERDVPPCRWSKPPAILVKINFDGATSLVRSSAGCIIRDHYGNLIYARVVPSCLCSSLESEAHALLESLLFAISCGISKDVFEGDCATLINFLLEGNGIPLWSVTTLFLSCKNIINHHPEFSVAFSPRLTNKAAHALARFGLSCNSSFTWSSAPLFLKKIVLADSAEFSNEY